MPTSVAGNMNEATWGLLGDRGENRGGGGGGVGVWCQ